MFIENIINQKKQKAALLKNAANLQKIHDEYYELKKYTNVVFDKPYVVERYVHAVKDILKRWRIASITELLFLMHRYCGKPYKTCQFCGETFTEISTRSTINRLDCEHKGICTVCNLPARSLEKKVCYDCKPRCDEKEVYDHLDPSNIFHRFYYRLGNPDYCSDIQTVEEAILMMNEAKEWYYHFKEVAQKLENEQLH